MKKYMYSLLTMAIILSVSLLCLTRSAWTQENARLDEEGNPIRTNRIQKADFVAGEILIKFKKGSLDLIELEKDALTFDLSGRIVKDDSLRNALQAVGSGQLRKVVTRLKPSQKVSIARSGKQVAIPDLYNLMVLKVPLSADIQKLSEKLSALEGVNYAEPNYIFQPASYPPNDPLYLQGKQLGFENPVNDRDIDAETAWDYTTGSSSVRLGVIDSGIDYNNEDLGGGQWGSNGDKVRDGWNYEDDDPDPIDVGQGSGGHGTSVAGIIGALRNNSKGVAGLNGGDGGSSIGGELIALRVGTDTYPNDKVIDALVEASLSQPSGFGCHVVNLSFGGAPYNEAVRDAIRFASANNVVVAASKGNRGLNTIQYPADYDGSWIIAVGASNDLDERKGDSNWGWGIDVIAPGDPELVHTTKTGAARYGTFSQTSAATAHVSGLAGLIKAIDFARPDLDLHPEDVEGIIEASAEKVGGYSYAQNGWDPQAGHGRINAGDAMKMLHAPWALQHHTSTGGAITSSTGNYVATFTDPGNGPLDFGVYIVKRHEVTSWVDVPDFVEYHMWGRGVNETTGFSAANPNYQVGFTRVISKLITIARLKTYVFEVWSINTGQFLGWHPTTPSNVVYAYTTLGIPGTPPLPPPPPQNLVITNPGSVDQNPILSWNASAGATSYNIYRCVTNWIQGFCDWELKYSTTNTTFTDMAVLIKNPDPYGDTIHYHVKAVNSNGESNASNEVTTSGEVELFKQKTGPAAEGALPKQFTLHPNYPNPFNPTTEIRYELPENSQVNLSIFNLKGQEVRTLIEETQSPGFYNILWDGKDKFGRDVASGIYIYRIKVVPNTLDSVPIQTEKKMTLLR